MNPENFRNYSSRNALPEDIRERNAINIERDQREALRKYKLLQRRKMEILASLSEEQRKELQKVEDEMNLLSDDLPPDDPLANEAGLPNK